MIAPLLETQPPEALDEVAYLRFASVYKWFDSVGDFATERSGVGACRYSL